MLDKERLEEIKKLSLEQKWTFPRTFSALKEAGVESYEVWVPYHEIIYHGGGTQFVESHPQSANKVSVSENLKIKPLKEAISRGRKRTINFERFLDAIAKAGVQTYNAKMAESKITYVGKSGDEYSENIPPYSGR